MMKELSLNILDIAQNSIKARASFIGITITEDDEKLSFSVRDNGCGMTEEELRKSADPFFTYRTTRKVGLGIPFLKMAAEMTGGSMVVESTPESQGRPHGTTVTATFIKNSIDCMPLGNVAETVCTIIQGCPDVELEFAHVVHNNQIVLSTAQLREVLGADIPLDSFEVLEWIKHHLDEQYKKYRVKEW